MDENFPKEEKEIKNVNKPAEIGPKPTNPWTNKKVDEPEKETMSNKEAQKLIDEGKAEIPKEAIVSEKVKITPPKSVTSKVVAVDGVKLRVEEYPTLVDGNHLIFYKGQERKVRVMDCKIIPSDHNPVPTIKLFVRDIGTQNGEWIYGNNQDFILMRKNLKTQ